MLRRRIIAEMREFSTIVTYTRWWSDRSIDRTPISPPLPPSFPCVDRSVGRATTSATSANEWPREWTRYTRIRTRHLLSRSREFFFPPDQGGYRKGTSSHRSVDDAEFKIGDGAATIRQPRGERDRGIRGSVSFSFHFRSIRKKNRWCEWIGTGRAWGSRHRWTWGQRSRGSSLPPRGEASRIGRIRWSPRWTGEREHGTLCPNFPRAGPVKI